MFEGWARNLGWAYIHAFVSFFVDSIGWHVMQYKVSPINALWSPKDGPPIWLWQVDESSHLKLLEGFPNLVHFCPIWENDASKSIKKETIMNSGFFKKGTMVTKVGVLTKDYIFHMSYMYWSIKYQNCILNVIFGIGYYYWNQTWFILLLFYFFWQEDLDYSQMYNFVLNHDDKFWTLLTIKDVHNQNQQHLFKRFNTCAFLKKNTCGPSYEIY